MKLTCKKGIAWLCALVCAVSLTAPALAYTAIDTTQSTSLTLSYGSPNPIAGARFDLYRVADVEEDLTYTLFGVFKDLEVKLNGLDSSGWKAAAETLSAYVPQLDAKPAASGETGTNGRLQFNGLNVGLYLLIGQKKTIGRYTYTPEPVLVTLPSQGENGQWNYNPTVHPKYGQDYDPPSSGGNKTVSRKVLKVWEDDNWDQRPQDIVVQLLRNGKVYDTVTLNKQNGWKHTWDKLDKSDTWQVVESEVPEGYTVSVIQEGITFVLTNTHDTPDIPPDPDDPEEPKPPIDPEDPETPEPPVEPGTPDTPQPPTKPTLPQTGMLWWPVPVLACLGLGLFVTGWLRRRHEEQDEA